jgi:hypothetical protein
MSNLTELLPAGGGGKNVNFVASGTIGNGVTVGLNSDGTVTAVASEGIPEVIGARTTFEAASMHYAAIAYDATNNKIVIAYRDGGNSNYGTAIVGTVSGTSISFGSPVVFATANSQFIAITFDAGNSKVVISYMDGSNSNYGTSIVGTVSGTSISFGASVVFGSHVAYYISSTYDVAAGKIVVFYGNQSSAYAATLLVGTVSGTSISFGSPLIADSNGSLYCSCSYDPTNQKTVFAYGDSGSSYAGRSFVGTISGTSISIGSIATFEANNVTATAMTYDSVNEKTIIAYSRFGGNAIVATVSGTSISFGSPVIFNATAIGQQLSTSYNSSAGKITIVYAENPGPATFVVGSISGTSISFGSPVTFDSASTGYNTSVYDQTAKKIVIAYRDNSDSGYGKSYVLQNSNTNYTDFIGITDAAISDTASGSVTIKGGISTNVTGLTPNQNYYVQTDGTLSTTASDVLAGKALSSTSINLDYIT